MKQIVVVLILTVLCCSACSHPSAQIDSSNSASEIVSPSSLPDNDELSSESEETSVATDSSNSASDIASLPGLPDNAEHSSKSEQEETSVAADAPDYQGLTQEQWRILQEQMELYGDLSNDELLGAVFNGDIECINFTHFYWEDVIAGALVGHVGGNEFNTWTIEQKHAGQCTDIYSFAKHFSIELDELILLIENNNLVEVYDLNTVKRRYEYFIG